MASNDVAGAVGASTFDLRVLLNRAVRATVTSAAVSQLAQSAENEIARCIHKVIVLLDDLAFFVPPIDAELGQPILQ